MSVKCHQEGASDQEQGRMSEDLVFTLAEVAAYQM